MAPGGLGCENFVGRGVSIGRPANHREKRWTLTRIGACARFAPFSIPF